MTVKSIRNKTDGQVKSTALWDTLLHIVHIIDLEIVAYMKQAAQINSACLIQQMASSYKFGSSYFVVFRF